MYKVSDTIRDSFSPQEDKPYNIWLPLRQKHNSSKAFETEKKQNKSILTTS